MSDCLKCGEPVADLPAHPESRALCLNHLLILLRYKRWPKCGCGQRMYLPRAQCSRCGPPTIHTDLDKLDAAEKLFEAIRIEHEAIQEEKPHVPHDC